MLKKIILGFIIAVFLSLIGLVLFFPLDLFVKKKIDDAIGPGISFKNLKIGWYAITADDVSVKASAGTDVLKIKHIKLNPSILSLLKKKLEIKEIELDSPNLIIRKTKNGRWLLPRFNEKKGKGRVVDVIVKTFNVNNGEILFIDDVKGVELDLKAVSIGIKNKFSLIGSGKTSANASAKFHPTGKVSIHSEGDIITGKFKGVLSIRDLDITLLRPYIEGDVRVNKGRLSLDSNINLENGYVKAPSHLNVSDLDIETRGILMGISAPLVIELINKKGAIDLDFNIWGRWDNLQNDLKSSFKKKVFEELGRTITSPLEDIVKGIGGLLPGKK